MNILITGATSGIGYALTMHYIKNGDKVIALGRNSLVLNQLAQMGAYTIELDISNLNAVREKFKNIEIRFVDIAILNAGVCEYLDVKHFDAQLVKRVIDVNLLGLANMLEVILPLVRKSSVRQIVGVASLAGYLPITRAQAYGASKVAVDYFLESLAIDLASEKIDVTVINPGFVQTPLTAKNDFSMPFCLDVDTAINRIISGIEKKATEIHFPYRLSLTMKFLKLLPRRWWRWIGQRLIKK